MPVGWHGRRLMDALWCRQGAAYAPRMINSGTARCNSEIGRRRCVCRVCNHKHACGRQRHDRQAAHAGSKRHAQHARWMGRFGYARCWAQCAVSQGLHCTLSSGALFLRPRLQHPPLRIHLSRLEMKMRCGDLRASLSQQQARSASESGPERSTAG